MRNITDSNHTQEKTVRTISWKQEKKLTQDIKVKKTTNKQAKQEITI